LKELSSSELIPLNEPKTPKTPKKSREPTTPQKPTLPGTISDQTPTVHNTAGIVNSGEHRVFFDNELKNELGTSLYIGVPRFFEAFFGGVPNLQPIAETVFQKCKRGYYPLFREEAGGWQEWPKSADEAEVLSWFQKLMRKFLQLATEDHAVPISQMKIVRKPNQPVPGSVSKRKLDIGFVRNTKTHEQASYH